MARRLRFIGTTRASDSKREEALVNRRVVRLPTHIWFAKRAKLVEKWGYMVVETPTIKCHRMVIKAATSRGAIGWDFSFYSTVSLSGPKEDLEEVLKAVSSWGKSLQSKAKGEQGEHTAWEGWLHVGSITSRKPLAPAMVLFSSKVSTEGTKQAEALLRFHPSFHDSVWSELKKHLKTRSGLEISDLRSKLGSFHLIGPASGAVLNSLLSANTGNTFTSPFDCPIGSAFCLNLPGPSPQSTGAPVYLVPHNTRGFVLNRKPACPASDTWTNGLLQAWTLIVPLRHSSDTWKSLIRCISGNTTQSTQFAGWEEYCNLMRECGSEVSFKDSRLSTDHDRGVVVSSGLILRSTYGSKPGLRVDAKFFQTTHRTRLLPVHILIGPALKKAESDRVGECCTELKKYFCFAPKGTSTDLAVAGEIMDLERSYFSLREGTELFLGLLYHTDGLEEKVMQKAYGRILVKVGDKGWRWGRWRFVAI